MHISIPIDQTCEFIDITPINPLISKCQIKVCYVGEEPNRNKSIITKEVAKQMANSLPGCPIVGFFNETKGDFEEHNKVITISNGKIDIADSTIPYGFVDMHPRIWFQKFLDDNQVEHEYLMTEGYIWSGQYPEAQRVISKGNNQSMELDENTLDATWSKDNNGKPQFFIINEAIISKLCILGEDVEPCFEGSQITGIQFSLDEDFQTKFVQMANELKQILNEGEVNSMWTTYAVNIGDALWESLYTYLEKTFPRQDEDGYICGSTYRIVGIFEENGSEKFVILQHKENNKFYRMNFSLSESNGMVADGNLIEVQQTFIPTESQFSLEDIDAYEKARYTQVKEPAEGENLEFSNQEEGKSGQENTSETEESVKSYSLEEIEEYVALQASYSELEQKYNELNEQFTSLQEEINGLREFKNSADRKAKQEMINSFYMLSDDEKKDVLENIDTYSLDDIEAKLSIICVRNKVNFNLDENKEDSQVENKPIVTFNIDETIEEDNAPAWVKAVRSNMKK